MTKKRPWIGLLLIALLVKLSLPYYGGVMLVNNKNASNENRDQKILMCTATGLKWVAAFDLTAAQAGNSNIDGDQDDKKPGGPFSSMFKCAFCISTIEHFTAVTPELNFIAKLLFPKISSRWYSSSLRTTHLPFWFTPLLRAPPALFLTA
jgi:hypothetical protein